MREVLRSKNLALLQLTLREPRETVLDMAEAMLAQGVVQPRWRTTAPSPAVPVGQKREREDAV